MWYGHRMSFRRRLWLRFLAVCSLLLAMSDVPAQTVARADAIELYLASGHTTEIAAFTFSADGTTLATGGADGKIKLWRLVRRLYQV